MKTTFRVLAMLAISSAIVFAGCKKDDNNDDDIIPTNTSEFSAVIDGVQFTETTPGGLLDIDANELNIMGDNSTGTLMVDLNGDIAVGNYTVGSGTTQSISWIPESGFSYFARPGTIVVTKHDVVNNRIEGTFTATLESTLPPTISLTNGVFKISYTEL